MGVGLGGLSDGCLDHEKAALLQLKPFFYFLDGVNKWGELVEGKNCCEWERVECNPTTGRVIHLFLNRSTTETYADYVDTYIQYGYEYEAEFYSRDWYLNASLFLPFQELKSLYLGGNSIAGCLPNQDVTFAAVWITRNGRSAR
ncbi:putative serine-threonine protein kinase, plant-type [Corchorus olitorius]|uniref:Serine-threonine protein kinase, plant-type n=1 Tax=Corchorus olitorius TaxID=93759 RepID=A0A1R3GUF2_9ROSI|nr:putative serine-threonine protein kinase, plant-type [Corchorus olitorius]